jgi:hypothetical protein
MKAVLLTILLVSTIAVFAQRQYGIEDTTNKRRAVYSLPGDAVKVFPNPVVGDLYITVRMDSLSIKAVFLYDKDGNRIIEQRTNSSLSAPIKLNLSSYKPGIYYLVLETNRQPFRMQVIKN